MKNTTRYRALILLIIGMLLLPFNLFLNTTVKGTVDVCAVNSFDGTYADWTIHGASPYLSAKDYSTNYISTGDTGYYEGWFGFADTTASSGMVSATLKINAWGSSDAYDYSVYVDTSGGGGSGYSLVSGNNNPNAYQTLNLGSLTVAEANDLRIQVETDDAGIGTFYVDYAYCFFNYTAPSPTVITNDTTGVEETNATLHGTLTDAFNSTLYTAQGTYRKGYGDSSDVQCTPGTTEIPAAEYTRIQTVGGSYAESFSNSKKYSNFWFNFTINETVSDISSVTIYTRADIQDMDASFNWNSSGTLWVKNQGSGLWENKSYLTRIPTGVTLNRWMNATIASNIADYIQGGKLMFLIENSHEGDWDVVDLDYLMVKVTYNGSATVRFQYGFTTGYGTNSTNQHKDTGDSFLFDATGLTPGKLYHYRTYAYTNYGNGYGSDKTFLTKPNEPTGITITNTGSGEQTISWTHGTGYNRSVVRGTIGSYPATPQSGIAVYNGSSDSVVRSGLSIGDDWYYRVWEYSSWGSLHQFSDLYSNGHKTVIVAPAVTMNTPTGVTQTNATLHGTLTSDGGETCTVRFTYRCIPDFLLGPPPYPSWYVNWTNTTNQTKTIGQTFSANISANIPYPGVLVECKVFANNSITSYLSGSYYFMTPSNVATNFTATDLPTNHSQHLTWTKGTMARRTVIRVGTAGFPANPQSGTAVYNGTGSSCYYTGATLPGQLYYYRAWEYAVQEWGAPTGYFAFSNYTRIGCLTNPSSMTNLSVTTSSAPWVNLSWTKGLGANRTVLVLKEGSYPTSISDGTVIYNGTGSTYRYNMENYSSAFIMAWSFSTWTYNPTVTAISSNGTMWTLGKYLGVDVYNESDPSMALVFNVQIRNADGTEVVQYMNQSGFTFINMSGFTTTQDVFLRAWASDYQAREMYLEDFTSGYYYNVTFYLPKKVIDTGEDPEGGGGTEEQTLRAYIDSISVTSFAVDCHVPLTHTIESIINVEIYKNIGGFGDWVDVPQNKFTVYTTNVTIDKSVLDANTTMARVNYYYWTYSGEISTPVYYIRVVETIETEYSMYDKAIQGATVTVRRFMNTTGKYEIVSILLADANGYVNLYLIPNVQYLLTAEKTDYDTTNSSFIPVPPNALGQTAEKILRMVQTGIVAPPYNYSYLMKNIVWDYSPKGLQIEGAFTFYFNITSSDSQLDWYSLTVFQYNYTTRVWDNLSYQIAYLPGGGSLSYNVPNVTGRYAFECWFKKTGFDPYELSQTGSFEKLLVFFQDWMKQIPDEAIYLVLVVIMMIVAGFCFMYLGTGILTGYIALGIMAIGLLFVGDVNVPIGNAVTISGWIIFAITFIVYTFAIFLWSRM